MDKYRPCPSIIAMFTSDSQHPPRSKHAVYLGDNGISEIFFENVNYEKKSVEDRNIWKITQHAKNMPS